MKKCLITGAGGNIGHNLIAKLIATNEYEITALDLKSHRASKRLNKFNDINIVYGDINDSHLIQSLVEESDIIFHLAGVLPFNAQINDELTNIVNYEGSKIIVDAIKKKNPKAYLVYLSTTSIYGDVKNVSIDNELNIYNNDYYALNCYKIEDYIQKHIANYTIYRIPLVLDKNSIDKFMYNMPLNRNIEAISTTMLATALVNTIKNKRRLNKKITILSGGKKFRTTTNELMYNVLKVNGISFRYYVMYHFIPKNFYGHYYELDEQITKVLDYQDESLKEYYKTYEKNKKFNRFSHRLLACLILRKLSKKK